MSVLLKVVLLALLGVESWALVRVSAWRWSALGAEIIRWLTDPFLFGLGIVWAMLITGILASLWLYGWSRRLEATAGQTELNMARLAVEQGNQTAVEMLCNRARELGFILDARTEVEAYARELIPDLRRAVHLAGSFPMKGMVGTMTGFLMLRFAGFDVIGDRLGAAIGTAVSTTLAGGVGWLIANATTNHLENREEKLVREMRKVWGVIGGPEEEVVGREGSHAA